jgi:hypothetical protein
MAVYPNESDDKAYPKKAKLRFRSKGKKRPEPTEAERKAATMEALKKRC